MISTFPPAAAATPGRRDEAQGAHRAPVDGGGDPAVQLVCQLRGVEFVGTTVSGRPKPEVVAASNVARKPNFRLDPIRRRRQIVARASGDGVIADLSTNRRGRRWPRAGRGGRCSGGGPDPVDFFAEPVRGREIVDDGL